MGVLGAAAGADSGAVGLWADGVLAGACTVSAVAAGAPASLCSSAVLGAACCCASETSGADTRANADRAKPN